MAVRDGASSRRPRVAIVGAGLGGLACACALSRSTDVTVYERDSDIDQGDGGELQLRGMAATFAALGLSWDDLRALSRSPRECSIPLRALRHALIGRLRHGTVRFGACVVDLTPTITEADHLTPGPLRCHFSDGSTSERAFDIVVDAGGLGPPLSRARTGQMHPTARVAADAHAAIGDARLARMGWLASWLLNRDVRVHLSLHRTTAPAAPLALTPYLCG